MFIILPAFALLISGMFVATMIAAIAAERREAQQVRVRAHDRKVF